MRRGLLGGVCGAALALSGWGDRALAAPDRPRPVQPVRVEAGLGGALVAERFQPFVVWLAGGDKPLSGVAELTIDQDVTQRVRVSAPFSVEPGKQTPVEFLIAPPAFAADFRLRLDAPGFGEVWDSRLQAFDSPMQWTWSVSHAPLLVTIGDCSSRWIERTLGTTEGGEPSGDATIAPPTAPGQVILPPTSERQATLDDASRVGVGVGSMPLSWLAWDAATLVVIESDFDRGAPADPRALTALRDWLFQGGTLVVLADRAGQDWRRFLGPGEQPPVQLDELGPIPLAGVECRGVIPSVEGSSPFPELAASAVGRACVLTREGERRGWRSLWTLPGSAGGSERSLAAMGPAGLGRLVLVGVDPRRMMRTVRSDDGARIWWRLLSHPLRESLGEFEGDHEHHRAWDGSRRWERSRVAAETLRELLDSDVASRRIAPGWGPLAVLAGMGLGMIVLVWIVDARLARRREFAVGAVLSTAGWIVLLSVVGALVPGWMRAEDHGVFRNEVYDVVQGSDGSRVGWRTGTLGVFAGKTSTFRWNDPTPGACYRGVSPLEGWQRSRVGLADLELGLQWQEGSSRRAMGPGAMPMSVWSYRALLDRSPTLGDDALPPVRLSLGAEPEEIRVEGLPADAELLPGASVRWAGQAQDQELVARREGQGVYVLRPRRPEDPPGAAGGQVFPRLEGSQDRAWAIDRLCGRAGGAALVTLRWTTRDDRSSLATPQGVGAQRRVFWRVVLDAPRGGKP